MNKKSNSNNNTNENNMSKNNNRKYQISGLTENYIYDSEQGIPFDPTSISTSGRSGKSGLVDAVVNQQMFSNNYNNYKSQSTFNQQINNGSGSSGFNNLTDNSQYDLKDAFKQNTPILDMLDNKYMNNTLYNNLNENLLKETIRENVIHINSEDRNIETYPDPFSYIVTLGPITNSIVNYGDKTKNKNLPEIKNQIKKDFDLANIEINNPSFTFNSPDLIKKYTLEIINSVNPYISRSFERVKYFKIDISVLPRFNTIAINPYWNYNNSFIKKEYFKDDYDKIKSHYFPNFRYIPDDTDISPLGGRYIQVVIKDITNENSFGTNVISDKSYVFILDKVIGALYVKYNPHSAVKNYRESQPGNISRLSIQYYDSEGIKIKLNYDSINYEINQIKKTEIIDPSLYNLNDNICTINNSKICDWFITKFNDIIKSFIMVNFDITKLIPFYINAEFLNDSVKIKTEEDKETDNTYCIKNYSEIILNQETFTVKNIFKEFDEFITPNGFTNVYKLTNSGKKIKISIDSYINNIIWYDNNTKYIEIIKYNINAINENYNNFGFRLLDNLKIEITKLPTKSWFQNYLICVLGIFSNDLNTKVEYGNG
jgi:hypothetical protein